MNLTSRYGYLIDAIREYPFDAEIARIYESIEQPWRQSDVNQHIRGSVNIEPKALIDLIKKESCPKLVKLRIYKSAIENVYKDLSDEEFKLIQEVYVKQIYTVDGATNKYFGKGKNYGYQNIILPFFSKLEDEIVIISCNLRSKFTINVG